MKYTIHTIIMGAIAFLFLLVILYISEYQRSSEEIINEYCTLEFDNGVILKDVPVARSVAQQNRGLSKRDNPGVGMLFSWKYSNPRVFWMRDTRMYLSIGFLDPSGQIINIQGMEPLTDVYHYSTRPASDALELPQGKFAEYGLKEGSRLISRSCVLH
jgi:uncharacterized protein